jgi:lysophospholipase L1-like esterase
MRRAVLAIVLIAGGALASSRYGSASGVMVIVLGTLAPALVLGGARTVVGGPRLRGILDGALLTVVSVGVTLVAVDLGLAWLARAKQETTAVPAGPQGDSLIIPDEWKERPAQIPGAARAYYWHGKLHVYNQDFFRAIGDYARDDGKRRIVVLGDSLTYGVGIAAEDTYAAVLESLWKRTDPNVHVYNLGAPNAQSEDVVRVATKWLPILKPERVIYGICLNDFLPSAVGQYANNMAWQIPLPEEVKKPFEGTRLGAMTNELYNRALLGLGIRNDFFADILKDFRGYQTRFKRDLVELNRLAESETGKPVVALVLDQFPNDERGHRIARIAEAAAVEAGMNVVTTDAYFERFSDGKTQLFVSKWEGHPNEMANRIWAAMLASALELPVVATTGVLPVRTK